MHLLGYEMNRIALDLPLLEEVVEQRVLVAWEISVARNESGQPAILNRELNELGILQEGVHSRDVTRGVWRRGRLCGAKQRKKKRQEDEWNFHGATYIRP